MRLFLIRHGETIDNVANLYAGSRNSELTNHGFQQATRLGQYFRSTAVNFTHIFSSQLKRAVKTAELIRNAQFSTVDTTASVEIRQLRLLMEQDFGYYEGKSFLRRSNNTKSDKEAHRPIHKDDPGFVDVESKDAMALRVESFLDNHLCPIIKSDAVGREHIVAIVSHGILLSVLWRQLLLRLPLKTVTFHPEVLATHGQLDLERLGGWSNTGYLELEMRCNVVPSVSVLLPTSPDTVDVVSSLLDDGTSHDTSGLSISSPAPSVSTSTGTSANKLDGWSTTIRSVNSKQHLAGLKRTRGGVGSARHDESQKSIEHFFKKQKKNEMLGGSNNT